MKSVKKENKSAPATKKQMEYIKTLAHKAGYRYTDQAIKAYMGKKPVNGLNRLDASALIEWLNSK